MISIPKGIILSCEKDFLNEDEIDFFSNINPFGFILFSRNFKSKSQIKKLIKDLKSLSKNPSPLIFVDQEGGRVQRFKNHEFTKIPSQSFFGNLYKSDPKKAKELSYSIACLLGTELKDIGVDVNCSPVLDIFFDFGNSIIGDRAFSSDSMIVSHLGQEYCKGYRDSGIIPLIKHFPGHGRSELDSHKDLPIVNVSLSELKKKDLKPFKFLRNEIFLMLAHIIYKNIDSKVTPYSKIIKKELIEDYLNFKGLTISDDLDMKALKGELVEKTIKCYDGGCDIVLYCGGILNDMKKVYQKSRTIKEFKYEYFLKYKKNLKVKQTNMSALKKQLKLSETIE